MRSFLDTLDRDATIIVGIPGKREPRFYKFNIWFREIRAKAGLPDHQARDLRRTAVTKLGQAGCTDEEIANVTGHTYRSVKRILETYLPRNFKMSRAAILKWEKAGQE